jgi:hypothetical protein
MVAGVPKTQCFEPLAKRSRTGIVDREFDERDRGKGLSRWRIEQLAARDRALRHRIFPAGRDVQALASLAFQVQERAHRVGRGATIRRFPGRRR